MYHQFIPKKRQQDSRIRELINYYNKQSQNQEKSLGLWQNTKIGIHVDMKVDNSKHNCRLYILSNGKVLRQENQTKTVYQIEGLKGEEISQMRALEIGEVERYVLMTNKGVSVCTINKDEIRESVISTSAYEQQKMEQQQQQQKNLNKTLTISSIPCQLLGSVFIQQSNQKEEDNQNQHQHQHQHQDEDQQQQEWKNINNGYNYRQMFIVKNNSKKENQIVDSEEVFIVVVSYKGFIRGVTVHRVSVVSKMEKQSNQLELQQQQSIKIRNQFNIKPKQLCQIHPVILPNNKYSIQMLLTNLDIQSALKQNQQIDTIQLKYNNLIYSKAHPLIKVDSLICSLSNSFSIYFATQAINSLVQFHHTIFEFVLYVDKNQCKINAATFLYNKNKRLSPSRIYTLPFISQSTILKYFDVNKTIFHKVQDLKQNQQQCMIKITTVLSQSNQNKVTFLETQMSIGKGNQNQFGFQINQQNLSLHTAVKQKFILIDVLFLDTVKKYAILLVNQNGLKISLQDDKYYHKHTGNLLNQKQCKRQKFILLNLTPNITQRIVSSYQLDEEFNDCICNLTFFILKNKSVLGSHLVAELSSSQINMPKYAQVTNSKIIDNLILTQMIELIPKLNIYYKMLESVLNIKQTGQQQNQMKDQLDFSRESFMNSILKLLSI